MWPCRGGRRARGCDRRGRQDSPDDRAREYQAGQTTQTCPHDAIPPLFASGYIAEWPANTNRTTQIVTSPVMQNIWTTGGVRPESRRMDIRIQCLCIDTADP